MDVQEVLRFADEMVFAKTGEHLDDLQKAILLGVWEGQKYSQIAEASYCSEGHIRNVASKLWKRLSNVLDEEVNQSNLRSALERRQVFIVSQNLGNDFVFFNVNVSTDSQSSEYPEKRSPSAPTSDISQPQTRLDLADAPHISSLCDSPDGDSFASRTSELATLEKSIVQDKCNLAAILGISGIGKGASHFCKYIKRKVDH
ncbi:hypothetical protein QUB25_29880 [Microcoleus sp. B3-D7]